MLDSIIKSHQERYPLWRLEDLYKLIYQATMGIEHLGVDPDFARKMLEEEFSSMGNGPDDPLMDPISDDGSIVRIHLRPYLAAGGDVATLLEAFLQTSRGMHGNTQGLEAAWEQAVQMDPFPRISMTMLMNTMRRHNFPAVHHSEPYMKSYKPAYRVVMREYFNLEKLKNGK